MSNLTNHSKERLVIITAPSGAGKTTIVKHLMEAGLPVGFSVSACTRDRRNGEVDGQDYYFISKDEFRRKIANNEFAEYEEVYEGSYYGTLKVELERLWNQDKAVLFDIDVKGALALKNLFKENALTVFIQPPSVEVLIERLTARNTESEESLQKRIAKASLELSYRDKFDQTVLNDHLERACAETLALVKDFIQ